MKDWLEKIPESKKNDAPATQMRAIADALDIKVERIVELGVYKGGHAELLRAAFPTAELNLVDAWRHLWSSGPMMKKNPTDADWQSIYQNIVKKFGNDPYTKIHRCLIEDAPPIFNDGSCDLVYIDGDHRYESVKRDIFDWLPRVKSGGILAGHDYRTKDGEGFRGGKGVVKAVREIFGEGNYHVGQSRLWLYVKA